MARLFATNRRGLFRARLFLRARFAQAARRARRHPQRDRRRHAHRGMDESRRAAIRSTVQTGARGLAEAARELRARARAKGVSEKERGLAEAALRGDEEGRT